MWPFLLLGAGALYLFMKSDDGGSSEFVTVKDGIQVGNPNWGKDKSKAEQDALAQAALDFLTHLRVGEPEVEVAGDFKGLVKLPGGYSATATEAVLVANAEKVERAKKLSGLSDPWGIVYISDMRAVFAGAKPASFVQYFASEADARRIATPGSIYMALEPE